MTNRKILIPILSCILSLCLIFGVALTLQGNGVTANAGTWTADGGTWSGDPETGTATATTAESQEWASRYLTTPSVTGTSYTVSYTVSTTSNGSDQNNTNTQDYGIYPTFTDDNNYLVFYFRYELQSGTKMLACLSANDRTGGQNGWKDSIKWSDAAPFSTVLGGNRQYNSTQSTTIKVVRNGASYEIFFNGTSIYTYTSASTNATASVGKVGIYASGWSDGANFSNFACTANSTGGGGSQGGGSTPEITGWTSYGGTWTNGNPETGSVVSTTSASVDMTSRYLRSNTVEGNNYTISFTVRTASNGSSTSDELRRDYGVYPTFVNEDNFVLFYFSYENDDGNGTKMLRHISVNDRSNAQDKWELVSWSDQAPFSTVLGGNRKYDSTQETQIKVVRRGSTYEIYFNGAIIASYYSSTANDTIATAKIGVYASGWADGCTFTNFQELASSSTGGGGTGAVGGTGTDTITALGKDFKGDKNVWKAEGDTLVGNNTEWMDNYLVTPSNLTGDYTFVATFKGTGVSADTETEEIQFGFLPWYVDENNYILVMLKWDNSEDGLVDVHIVNGEDPATWNDYWIQDYSLKAKNLKASDQITIKITKERDTQSVGKDRYTIYINNEYIRSECYRASVNNTQPASVGFVTYNDTLTVSSFSLTQGAGMGEVDFGDGDGGNFGGTGSSEDVLNNFAKFLVPWGIVILCGLCVLPFFVGVTKNLLYKLKK